MFLNIVCKPESTAESIESAVAVVFGVVLLSQLVDCKTKYLIQNKVVIFSDKYNIIYSLLHIVTRFLHTPKKCYFLLQC